MPKDKNGRPEQDSTILKEIRDNFAYYTDSWRDIREEAKTDMRYVSGDPWDPKDRKFREDNDRPCMTWDELSPYVNQLINDPRQNKRAIQVNPIGSGANDKTAELRGNLIRAIEYNSKAQSAYTTGFQGAAERSYGFWRVGKRYVTSTGKSAAPDAFNQELYIGRIPNPDSVLFDPNFKEVDCSDAMGCFVTDVIRKVDFKRRFPNAEVQSFTPDIAEIAPSWIREKEIMIGEYWRVTIEKDTLHLFDQEEGGPVAFFEDELPTGFETSKSVRQREIERRVVTQYITNGVEILEEEKIEIPWIPIIPVFGKEIYVDDGGGSRRRLISLVRMARDPFMAYCFYRSQEAEEAGMTPKVPFIGYVGQFATDAEAWESCNKIPRAMLQVDPVTDPTGQQILPLPTRQPFSPNFQSYEIACEAARRAIMTAMSGSNLPTSAQRQNQKSGAALKEIDEQENRGTFHFIDNYNFALEQTGRILDAWIPYVYDTKREVGIREPDGTHKVIKINDPDNMENGEPEVYDTTEGKHSVTISTGPSYQSQREEASQFVDTLVANIQTIAQALPPGAAAKLMALAIKLKQIGPIGEEMADVISPPQDQATQQQAMAQGQAQLQQQTEVIAQLQKELQKLQLEKAGKVVDNEYKTKMNTENNDVKVLIAEVNTQMQSLQQRTEMFMQYWNETHQAAHETAMQSQQQAHEADQSQQAAQLQTTLAQQQPASPDANSGQGAAQ